MTHDSNPSVRLQPWAEHDLPLLEKLMGDPDLTAYVGGPETPEQIAHRHERYLKLNGSGAGQMFTIFVEGVPEPVGSNGYWEKDWQEQTVYETGWFILPAFQGRGLASQATVALMALIRPDAKHRWVHAFPSVENGASNGVCRKAGFTFVEAVDFEHPKDHIMRCNDWRFDLGEIVP